MADDFYRTTMGHRFYEGTMPALVKQLDRLNDNLENKVINKATKDHELIVAIQEVLSGKQWDADTVMIIAGLLNSYGYKIEPPP